MVQNENKIDFYHFSSWLLKDVFWLLKWKLLSTFMVIPTLGLTIYILFKTKKFLSIETIFSSWVMTNIFWMLHELYDTPLYLSYPFIILGIFTIVLYLIKNFKSFSIK